MTDSMLLLTRLRHVSISLTETGSDGSSTLSEVEFIYNIVDNGYSENSVWAIPNDMAVDDTKDQGVRLLDANGDGLIDVLKAKDSYHKIRYNNGNGFDGLQTISNFIPSGFVDSAGFDKGVRLLDVNGDTWIDVLQSITGDFTSTKLLINDKGEFIEQLESRLRSGDRGDDPEEDPVKVELADQGRNYSMKDAAKFAQIGYTTIRRESRREPKNRRYPHLSFQGAFVTGSSLYKDQIRRYCDGKTPPKERIVREGDRQFLILEE